MITNLVLFFLKYVGGAFVILFIFCAILVGGALLMYHVAPGSELDVISKIWPQYGYLPNNIGYDKIFLKICGLFFFAIGCVFLYFEKKNI